MSAGVLELDASQVEALASAVSGYGERAEEAINEVLHDEAGPLIYRKINPLIHPSGRTFKGHSASATVSDWASYDTTRNLEVTVRADASHRYLYFPDDGGTTVRHQGNQQFFKRGGESATPEIVERCLRVLTKDWS